MDLKSAGFTVGTLARMNFAGRRVHVVRSRLEYRYSSADYLPGYFGTDYRLTRRAHSEEGPTRLDRLAALEVRGKAGNPRRIYLPLHGPFFRGVLYEASKLPEPNKEMLGSVILWHILP